MGEVLIYIVVGGIITGFLGSYISSEKNRGGAEGFFIGFLFSLLGVLILALLPNKSKKQTKELTEEQKRIRQEKIKKGQDVVVRNNKILFGVVVLFLIVAFLLFLRKQKENTESEMAYIFHYK